MKTLFIIFFYLIASASFSCAQIQYKKSIGFLSLYDHCMLIKDKNMVVKCNDKNKAYTGKLISRNIYFSSASFYSSHSADFIVFDKKGESFQLGYLWDLNKQQIIDLNNNKINIEAYGHSFYANEFTKKNYEVRYFWYTPGQKKSKMISNYNYFLNNNIFRISENEPTKMELHEKPNGKVLYTVNQSQMKKLKIDSKISEYHGSSSLLKMHLKINDFKIKDNIHWVKVTIPLESEIEISYKVIKYKQSIFDQDVTGWMKLYNKSNRMLLRTYIAD